VLSVRKMGDAKVCDLDGLPVRRPQKVRGFDVSVNDSLIVY
jgi:hypothetical protein